MRLEIHVNLTDMNCKEANIKRDNSATSKQVLELTPKSALTFRDKLGHVGSVSLILKNSGMSAIYFKVKSNASRFYSVHPNTGVIGPYGRKKVIVQLNDDSSAKLDEIEANQHKFLIMSATMSDSSVEVEEFWKGKKEGSEGVYAVKLKAKVDRFSQQKREVAKVETEDYPKQNGIVAEPTNEVLEQNGKIASPHSEDKMSEHNGKIASPHSEDSMSEHNGKIASPHSEDSMSEHNGKIASPDLKDNVPEQNGKIASPHLKDNVPEQNGKIASPEPKNNISEQHEIVASPILEKNVQGPNSDLASCALESTCLSSPVNHLFAQYCAEMVGMLLEKMSARDGFELRKELNNILTKYEAGVIDE